MYRSTGENENDKHASLLSFNDDVLNYGGGGNLQDMYLETSTLPSGTPSSSLATSPPSTPMTPDPLYLGYPLDFSSIQYHRFFNTDTLLSNSINNSAGGSSINNLGAVGTMPQSYLRQRQQQQQQQHQQQQYLAMLQQRHQMAQKKLSIATIAANASGAGDHHQHLFHQQQNEISNSLKMYAMYTAYKDGIDKNNGQVDVMQEFAANGYTTDDVYLQQYPTINRSPLSSPATNVAPNMDFLAAAAAQQQQQFVLHLQTQNWLNINFPDPQNISNIDQLQYQNVWLLPSMIPLSPNPLSPTTTTASQTAVTTNTSGGSSNLSSEANVSSINTSGGSASNSSGGGAVHKSIKRQMKDKVASMKHCVFCENNNEPEAVTKSHSVRDSLGRVLCPKLRTYVCPICKASGDNAHTVKYCPKKPIITMEDAIRAQTIRLAKNTYQNNKQMKV